MEEPIIPRTSRLGDPLQGTKADAGYPPLLVALPPAEERVRALAAQGYAPKEIAYKLERSVKTVRNQLSSIYSKLGVDRGGLIRMDLRAAYFAGWEACRADIHEARSGPG
jgi:DNA-binding NarL/FixJ family response regulator